MVPCDEGVDGIARVSDSGKTSASDFDPDCAILRGQSGNREFLSPLGLKCVAKVERDCNRLRNLGQDGRKRTAIPQSPNWMRHNAGTYAKGRLSWAREEPEAELFQVCKTAVKFETIRMRTAHPMQIL
jgi:hypothetical protein